VTLPDALVTSQRITSFEACLPASAAVNV